MPQLPPRPCRPREHVAAAGRTYPGAWRHLGLLRAGRGQDVPDWPDWCYLPIAAARAIVAEDAGVPDAELGRRHPERVVDAARIAALGAWRMTQGIYRFDPAVYEAVRDTPVSGDIPHDVLYRLPEWCVYVETPGMALDQMRVHGFFAHLEHDAAGDELRLLLDTDMMLLPVPLMLGAMPLAESIQRILDSASRQAARLGTTLHAPGDPRAGLRTIAEPLVSLLLYLCSQASEIGDGSRRPSNPEPKRTRRHGWRIFPAERPYTWDVGVRLGAALRRAYAAAETGGGGGERERARAHIRRAHWHGFRSGPRKRDDGSEIPAAQRQFDLRWLPPIPVNVDDTADMPAVVRPVR